MVSCVTNVHRELFFNAKAVQSVIFGYIPFRVAEVGQDRF
jgi:hypothetical protein